MTIGVKIRTVLEFVFSRRALNLWFYFSALFYSEDKALCRTGSPYSLTFIIFYSSDKWKTAAIITEVYFSSYKNEYYSLIYVFHIHSHKKEIVKISEIIGKLKSFSHPGFYAGKSKVGFKGLWTTQNCL